jgi:hypothetical protein
MHLELAIEQCLLGAEVHIATDDKKVFGKWTSCMGWAQVNIAYMC